MGMERVTVEQNGERFTLEVPEGTSDADIQSFVSQQQGGRTGLTTPEPQITENVMAQTGMAAVRPAGGMVAAQAGDIAKLARIAGEVTPNVIGEFLSTPIKSAKELAGAYLAGHPLAGQALNTPLKAMPGALARGIGTAMVAPESSFLMPYNMAAYEQEKIRANPTAPEYASNPYAMTVRGEAPTQAQAGAINQRLALMGQRYGGVTPEQQQILQQDRQRQQAQMIAKQPPTTQNYMQRMRALSELYSPVTQP